MKLILSTLFLGGTAAIVPGLQETAPPDAAAGQSRPLAEPLVEVTEAVSAQLPILADVPVIATSLALVQEQDDETRVLQGAADDLKAELETLREELATIQSRMAAEQAAAASKEARAIAGQARQEARRAAEEARATLGPRNSRRIARELAEVREKLQAGKKALDEERRAFAVRVRELDEVRARAKAEVKAADSQRRAFPKGWFAAEKAPGAGQQQGSSTTINIHVEEGDVHIDTNGAEVRTSTARIGRMRPRSGGQKGAVRWRTLFGSEDDEGTEVIIERMGDEIEEIVEDVVDERFGDLEDVLEEYEIDVKGGIGTILRSGALPEVERRFLFGTEGKPGVYSRIIRLKDGEPIELDVEAEVDGKGIGLSFGGGFIFDTEEVDEECVEEECEEEETAEEPEHDGRVVLAPGAGPAAPRRLTLLPPGPSAPSPAPAPPAPPVATGRITLAGPTAPGALAPPTPAGPFTPSAGSGSDAELIRIARDIRSELRAMRAELAEIREAIGAEAPRSRAGRSPRDDRARAPRERRERRSRRSR